MDRVTRTRTRVLHGLMLETEPRVWVAVNLAYGRVTTCETWNDVVPSSAGDVALHVRTTIEAATWDA